MKVECDDWIAIWVDVVVVDPPAGAFCSAQNWSLQREVRRHNATTTMTLFSGAERGEGTRSREFSGGEHLMHRGSAKERPNQPHHALESLKQARAGVVVTLHGDARGASLAADPEAPTQAKAPYDY